MTTSKTDLEGSIKSTMSKLTKQRVKKVRTPKITYVRYSQTRRLNTLESHFCLRTTTFFGSFRTRFSEPSS